jgi:predicted DNA-binding transcriptional regulator AlpA
MNNELLTIGDVVNLMRASRSTIYRWINDGILPKPSKIKGKVLFDRIGITKALQDRGLTIK